jgi:hypothetical protein
LAPAALHLDELRHHFVLARARQVEARGVGVAVRVVAELFEAGVAIARDGCGGGIDPIEMLEHRLYRGVQAVEVEPVEANRRRAGMFGVVVLAQPTDEVEHVGIAPHPLGKPAEVSERVDGVLVVAAAVNVTVDAIRGGPIGLGGDGNEAPVDDEPLGQLRAFAIELVRAVRRLADEHELRVADGVDGGVVIVGAAVQRRGTAAERARQLHIVRRHGRTSAWKR